MTSDSEVASDDDSRNEFVMPEAQAELIDNRYQDNYDVLIMGNSHSANLGDNLKLLLIHSNSEKSARLVTAPGIDFLDERPYDGFSLPLLKANNWTHVILQAQKYSQSGKRRYSTQAAQIWVRLAKLQGATPILFPEHPQRGNNREAKRVHEIHQSIAEQEPACVSPIGLAWDEALLRERSLNLHQYDGNHASETGELLTALVFYQIITGQSALSLPHLNEIDVPEATQNLLKQVAADTLALHPACN